MNCGRAALPVMFLVWSIGSFAADPAKQASKVTGVFSDLRYVAQGGDVVGTEIILVYGGGLHFVLVQCAEGRMGQPQLLPALVEYPRLKFTVPSNTPTSCPAGAFTGTISSRGLRGKISGLEWPGFLPRGKSHWQ